MRRTLPGKPRLVLDRDLSIPMRDGVLTVADAWHPSDMRAGPTILFRTPYSKDQTPRSTLLDPRRACDAGFHVVVQDVRGRGVSAGNFEPFAREAEDGVDTVRWVREQTWSDGRVVTAGSSYLGLVQLLTAGLHPEGLEAVAPALAPNQLGEGFSHRNGVLELGFLVTWFHTSLMPESCRVYDEDRMPFESPFNSFHGTPWAERWLREGSDGTLWKRLSPPSFRRVPGLMIGGWFDCFLDGALNEWGRSVSTSDRLIVGPWGHDPDLSHLVGDYNLGSAGMGAAVDVCGRTLSFYRDVLDDRPPAGPPALVYVLGRREWVGLDAWPPEGTTVVTLPIESGQFTVDIGDLPAAHGGRGLMVMTRPGNDSGPRDQSYLAARDDVHLARLGRLPTNEPITLAGPVVVDLSVEATGLTHRQWVAVLCIDTGDGNLMNLAEGVAVVSAGSTKVRIPLGHVCVTVEPRAELVLLLMGALWPRWMPPNESAIQSVLAPSHLELSVTDAL